MFVNFITQLVLDLALLLVFSVPLVLIAFRRGRRDLARKFLIAGAVVAAVTALIGASSEQLVKQCFDAGNTGCEDFGSSGFRMLLMGGYILVALAEAYLVYQD